MASPPPQSSSRCGMGQFALALIAIVTNSAYTSLPPILPLEIDHHNLDEKCTSIVFLAFTIGSLVAPPLVSRHFEKFGTVQVIAYSLAGMALGFWCLGHVFSVLDGDEVTPPEEEMEIMDVISDSINGATSASQDTLDINDELLPLPNSNDLEPEDDPTKFGLLPPIIPHNPHQTIIVIFLTIIQLFLGAFYATITTGYYSLVTLIFAGSAESAMSSVEAAVGVGYVVGPIFGSMLYERMGYRYCYGTISLCMLFMAGITLKILAPYLQGGSEESAGYSIAAQQSGEEGGGGDLELSEMDNNNNTDNSNELDNDHHGHDVRETAAVDTLSQHQPASALSLLKFPKLLIGAMTLTWIDVTWSFLEPLLSKHLDHTFDVSMSEIGVIFSITSIVYVPAVYLVQFLPSSGQGRHRTISAAVMLSPIGVLCVGSNSLTILILGVVLLGIFPTPVFVMLLPWMQEKALDLYPDPNVSRLVNDLTATIYNTALTMGQITGYILGPLLASRGFSQTTKLVALLTFSQGVIFFVGAGGSEPAGEREEVSRYLTVEDDDERKSTEMTTTARTPNRRRRSDEYVDEGENVNPNSKVSSTPPKEK